MIYVTINVCYHKKFRECLVLSESHAVMYIVCTCVCVRACVTRGGDVCNGEGLHAAFALQTDSSAKVFQQALLCQLGQQVKVRRGKIKTYPVVCDHTIAAHMWRVF